MNGKTITSFNEFKKEFEEKAKDPRYTVFLYCIACLEYAKGNKDGEYMATLTLPKNDLNVSPGSPSGFTLARTERYMLDQIKSRPRIIKSYLGGTPKNGYQIDEGNLELDIINDNIQDDRGSIIIQSAGKDNPTPLKLAKNNQGIWKITSGTSSIATGVKLTVKEKGDF